ncbi:MAG: membrane integrity-associated transporter subunit PqiC [Betaproteobacteria bacterium]|nr:membrane integrity-associated transporter subunit PqiC [Betaproteobacteria bacterium]
MIRKSAALLCAFLLTACMGGLRSSSDVALYDLGPPASVLAGAATASTGVAIEIRLPGWFDATNMAYRLAYQDSQRLFSYTQARWAGAPATLLQQRLRQRLAVVSGGATCTLRLELDEFSQVFSAASQSTALIQGEALMLGKARSLLARQSVRIEVPAGRDAASGALALSAATDALAKQLLPLLEQNSTGCRPLAAAN